MLAELIPKIALMGARKEYKYYPRPSSAGPERCIRSMVYHGLGVDKSPLPARALLIFDDSSWHEELTADWIRKTSFHLHSEQMRVECAKPMTNGMIDGIITDLLGVDRLWEHKAINHFTFQKFWGGELPLDNIAQCVVYMDGLRKDNPDINETILLIKNKNTAQYMEFILHYSQDDVLTVVEKSHSDGSHEKIGVELPNILKEICNKFNKTDDYIKRKTLPKRQYEIDHWRCSYCQYGQGCWDGYEQEFEELMVEGMLSNEVADMVRYYKELGGQKKDITKEYEDLKDQIKSAMETACIGKGTAGEYTLNLKLVKTSRVDKTLIPADILAGATKHSHQKRLTIRKRGFVK